MIHIEDPTRLGAVIANLRIASLLSQRDLCARVDMHQARLSDWETGRAIPAVPYLVRVLGALGYRLVITPAAEAKPEPRGKPIVLRSLKQLADTLRRRRKQRGHTIRGLGHRAGFESARISGWELGHHVPGTASLMTVADALGYDLALIPREDS